MHRNNILIYIKQDANLHCSFFLETALRVSASTSTHHQEHIQLYLQHLIFVRPLLLPAAIAAGSSNGLTNIRWCRYSCMRSWWWVEVPPETRRAVSRKNKLCNFASRWIYIRKQAKLIALVKVQLINVIMTCFLWLQSDYFCHILFIFGFFPLFLIALILPSLTPKDLYVTLYGRST